MLIGDTYADIMYAREIISEAPEKLHQHAEILDNYEIRLEELETIADEIDPDDLVKAADELAKQVEIAILNLTRG